MKPFVIPSLIALITLMGFAISAPYMYLAAIALGLARLAWESIEKIREGRWSLDYIAMLAMATALVSSEYYLAGAIIGVMITLSSALEGYGAQRAEASLKALIDRLPKTCHVKTPQGYIAVAIQEVQEESVIFIKTNELIPLDGTLESARATINQANLTGESLPIDVLPNEFIKSGSVNVGPSFELKTSGTFATSSYQKIITLVKESKKYPAGTVRLAQKFNLPFTAISLAIAGATYLATRDLARTLAVLAIATPCPLLIAAPIAFLGGMSKAAKKTIIIKKPAVLETLAQATTIYFDKTGTLTLGEPKLSEISLIDKNIDADHALVIAAAIEMHSLHPLARAITAQRVLRPLPELSAANVAETIGHGITGTVEGREYTILKSTQPADTGIILDMQSGDKLIARFSFIDQMKENTPAVLASLAKRYALAIITGDSEENTRRLFGADTMKIYARATPERKFELVKTSRLAKEIVIMVGDGLNDAPALAMADAGIVFSGTENSASIEAASAAILSHDILLVPEILSIARRTVAIARQSIIIGIALSVIGMAFAGFGFITPVIAAILQELIDVGVTINALRASQ